jgi:mannose-6-phosphate isomerase-like protein (cupin superfamily)
MPIRHEKVEKSVLDRMIFENHDAERHREKIMTEETTNYTKCFLATALGLAVIVPVYAQEVPEGVVMLNAAKAQWDKSPFGEQLKVLGDQTKAGPYILLTKPRPGRSGASEPHTHPDTRTYTVISGTWYVGFGTKYDESKLIALTAGSYYTEPAGVPHFILIKDEGVVVQVTGAGPSRLIPVDAAKK